MQAMAEGQRRGGDDDGTRGQHVNRRRKYIGYTTWLLLLFFFCYRFVVSHMLAMAEGHAGYGEEDGGEDNIAEESTLAILPVCCFLVVF